MKYAIPVIEIMSKKPVTIGREATAEEVGRLMKERDVGSLLVVVDGRPLGIVTEKDLVTKVVAANLTPSAVKVSDIMSSPVEQIHPHTEVLEAARRMAARRIRRLAVVDGQSLVGVVTENDILRAWPTLIEVTRERDRVASFAEGDVVAGYCEACSMFSETLLPMDGRMLCRECRQAAA
jgi:CBS domain-containing protein